MVAIVCIPIGHARVWGRVGSPRRSDGGERAERMPDREFQRLGSLTEVAASDFAQDSFLGPRMGTWFDAWACAVQQRGPLAAGVGRDGFVIVEVARPGVHLPGRTAIVAVRFCRSAESGPEREGAGSASSQGRSPWGVAVIQRRWYRTPMMISRTRRLR